MCDESRQHGSNGGLRHEVVLVIVVLGVMPRHNPLSHQRYPTEMCGKVTTRRPKSRVAVTRGNIGSASYSPHSVLPEITKPLGCQVRVAYRVLNMAVPEILLNGAGIDTFVREVKATRMAEHVRMDRKR